MTPELTNIIQLIKAKEFELAHQLLIGNPWIYMDCSINDFNMIWKAYKPEYENIVLDCNEWIFRELDRNVLIYDFCYHPEYG